MKKILRTFAICLASWMVFGSIGIIALAAPADQKKGEMQPPAQQEAPGPDGKAPAEGENPPAEGTTPPAEGENPPEKPADEASDQKSGEVPKEPAEKPEIVPDMTEVFEKLLALIEDLDDEEVKENLTELYENFAEALDAEKEAIDNESDEDTIEELKEAVISARDELEKALNEAGIIFNLEADNDNPNEDRKIDEEAAPKNDDKPVNEAESADTTSTKTSFIKKIGNAIVSFFNKLKGQK
jgi:hypothetical protein